jgi:hypothetical protein
LPWFIALFLNALYLAGLPLPVRNMPGVQQPTSRDGIDLELIDEVPEERYVETNPDVPVNEPDDTNQISDRDQQSAQENVAGPQNSPTPFVKGEDEESMKILEGAMPEQGEEAARQPPVQVVQSQPSDSPEPSPDEETMEAERQAASMQGGAPPSDQTFLDDLPRIPPPPPTPDFIDPVESEDEDGIEIPMIKGKGS